MAAVHGRPGMSGMKQDRAGLVSTRVAAAAERFINFEADPPPFSSSFFTDAAAAEARVHMLSTTEG